MYASELQSRGILTQDPVMLAQLDKPPLSWSIAMEWLTKVKLLSANIFDIFTPKRKIQVQWPPN
jgi:hypothetical protein